MASIPYSSVITTERLPIDAQAVVTKVRLVVAGNRAGRAPDRQTAYDNSTGGMVTYFPDPIVYEYEAPEHEDYGCVRSFSLPEGFNPFLSPADLSIPDPESSTGFVETSAIRDGDPTTFSTLPDGTSGSIVYPMSTAFRGFKLVMEGRITDSLGWIEVRARAGQVPRLPEGSTPYGVYWQFDVPADGNTENDHDLYAVLPHDARNQLVNAGDAAPDFRLFLWIGASTAGVRVNAFYPLVLNEALLEEVARANVRLPASTPSRVTVDGLVDPDRSHTITGWPGGDYTGVVAQYQYDLGRTIIDFEQAGSPVGLPAEAIESARERRAATDAIVEAASYPVRLGERA